MPVITESDKIALQFGVEQDVDWVALSFVRTGEDVRYARAHLNQLNSRAPVMAKLERRECIDNLDEILREVDGIMVARGDLGVEMPMEEVPVIQKNMVKKANEAGKISSVATQMLRSMVNSPTPTRAEISDIANAVLDGCDSILLSDEIAVGGYPVEAVRIADAAIVQAEKMYNYYTETPQRDQTQSVAWGATQLTKSLDAKPIVITSTGRAAFEMSRFRPENDVLVFSHDEVVQRRVCMAWGLAPKGVIPGEAGCGETGDPAGRRSDGDGAGIGARYGHVGTRFYDRSYRHHQHDPGAEHSRISEPHWPHRSAPRRSGAGLKNPLE